MSLLAGLDRPDLGRILIDKHDMTRLTEEDLSVVRGRKMGIVFQDFHLMKHFTAWENVALPLQIFNHKNAKERAVHALNKVGLLNRADHFPYQLSGGEQQRVALARAFVANPEIILADEPSGNLDQETGTNVMDLLFTLIKNNNTTLILVTHDSNLANKCTKKLLLSKGQFIEEKS